MFDDQTQLPGSVSQLCKTIFQGKTRMALVVEKFRKVEKKFCKLAKTFRYFAG